MAATRLRSRGPAWLLRATAGALVAGIGAVAVLAACSALPLSPTEPAVARDAGERQRILALGPWPPAAMPDPDNPASGSPAGIALGERLFHSAQLSPAGGVRCASCHEPWRRFTDGRAQALGRAPGARNTPSLLNVAWHRHFGWDGANDHLWRQSLRPLQDAREMPADARQVAALVRSEPTLARDYAGAFGTSPGDDDDRVRDDVGRALAAYAETLRSARTPFDDWRDALAATPGGTLPAPTTAFPSPALRGLRLFVGRGGCSACHGGPTFGDDDFHVSRVHSLGTDGRPDAGRAEGPANAFRTPGLREVAGTAPYMHDGSVASLCDAARPHAAAAAEDAPAGSADPLGPGDRSDLVAFLLTLGTAQAGAPASPAIHCDGP